MVLFLLLLLAGCGWSDNLDFTTGLGLSVPMTVVTTGASPFLWVETLTVAADYPIPFLPFIFLEAAGSFDRLQVRQITQYSVSTAGAGAGAGITFGLGTRLRLNVAADAGYLVVAYDDSASTSWFVQARSTLLLYVNQSFALGAGVLYKLINGLYEGAGVFISVTQKVPIEAMGG